MLVLLSDALLPLSSTLTNTVDTVWGGGSFSS